MKSKEYAQKYLEADYKDSENVLAEINSDIFNEMKTLIDQRKIKHDHQLLPIIKDTDQKFRKFATIVNADNRRSHNIKPAGFLNVLAVKMPQIAEFYLKSLKK